MWCGAHRPIAGLVAPIGVDGWRRLPAGEVCLPTLPAGSIALDGEREFSFDPHQSVTISLTDRAFRTVDVAAVMRTAGTRGLLRSVPSHAYA